MMMTRRKMLGLAVTERSITAVEVAVVHGRRHVLHAAEFPMPGGDAPQDPALLGKELRRFLRRNHFSASRAVVGIGTRWLVAKEQSLPPTAADLMAGVLSLAAEREFASDPKDLACDYSGPVDSSEGQSVLLVAAPRRSVDHLLATARAAGLTVAAVTSSTMALASATGGPASARRLVLYLSPTATELSVSSGGGCRMVRRLATSLPAATAARPCPEEDRLDGLADELRQVITLLPGAKTPPQGPDLLIWNASGLPAAALGRLGERLSLAVRLCEYPADLGISDGPAAPAGEFVTAAALALAGLDSRTLAVDLVHSRLNPRKRFALRRKFAWAVGLAAAVLLAGIALLVDLRWEGQEVQDLKDRLDSMKDGLAAAKDIVDKAAFARGWYDRRPTHLDCLRELTLAFPEAGRSWTTSLAIGEDMRVLLSGKATDEGAALEVMDRLKASPRFSDVKPLYIREVGGGAHEVSFAISLQFVTAERS
jgi:hypothetical protein